MRNKIVLIKGDANISHKITLAQFERINADAVVFITALKYPQFMPEIEPRLDLARLQTRIKEIMDYWMSIDQCFTLFTEYASVVRTTGINSIKCVEGTSLTVPWFYDAVKALHRNSNQIIVECDVYGEFADINNVRMTVEEAISRLGPNSSLG